ncbi:MAG: thiolase family protein [Rhodothermales bacterium]
MAEGSSLSGRRYDNGFGTSYRGVSVVAGARTPFGRISGSLAGVNATQLGTVVGKAAIERAKIDPETIDQLVFANVHPSSVDAVFLPRHITLRCGLRRHTPAMLVQRICGSGIETIATAADQICTARARAVLVGGADSTSLTPTVSFGGRDGYRFGASPGFKDLFFEALTDSFAGIPLAITAENLAEEYALSREEVDVYAARSQHEAARATETGILQEEIVPVIAGNGIRLNGRKKEFIRDETLRSTTTLQGLAGLPPVFKKDGVQTAGNSSALADGAAALVVAGDEEIERQGLSSLGRVVSVGVCGVDPEVMGIGPVPAIHIALEMAGLTVADIDCWEINEAFGAQIVAVEKALDLDREKLNVNGGAIAFGHPLAATGGRLSLTLLHELRRSGLRYGVASACIGGGQGIAMVFEVA